MPITEPSLSSSPREHTLLAPRAPETHLSPEEASRRERNHHAFLTAVTLDRDFFARIAPTGESLEPTIQRLDTVESLAFGAELQNTPIGDTSINQVSRCVYEGEPPVVAYVKPQLGEAFFRMNPTTRRAERVVRRFDPARNTPIEAVLPLETWEEERVRTTLTTNANYDYAGGIARHYGTTPERIGITNDRISARSGIEHGTSAVREYAVSRINELIGFDAVPLTCIRELPDGSDIASAQQGVRSTDPTMPAAPLPEEVYRALREQGKDHPGASSLMRLACLDYLVRTSDRHPENVIYDPVSAQFHGIDNAASFGVTSDVPIQRPDGSSHVLTVKDRYASVAMELVRRDPTWKLDGADLDKLEQLYTRIVQYLHRREDAPTHSLDAVLAEAPIPLNATSGAEAKYVTQLFRLLFRDARIAAQEALEFTARLGALVRHRGLPPLKTTTDILEYSTAFYGFPD